MTSLSTHILDSSARRPAPRVYRSAFAPPLPSFQRVELDVELGDSHYHVPLLIGQCG